MKNSLREQNTSEEERHLVRNEEEKLRNAHHIGIIISGEEGRPL